MIVDLFKQHKTKLAWLGLAVVVVVCAVILALPRIEKIGLYGKVGKHKVTKSEVKKIADSAKPYTEQQVGNALMDLYLYQDMSKDYDVSVSDAEVSQELYNRTGSDSPAGAEYLKTAVKRDLLRQKLEAAIKGFYEGRFVIAHFDRYIPFSGRDDITNPLKGRDARIASDRAYADSFLKSLHDRLDKKAITFSQAISEELLDPRLGQKALPTSLHSGIFKTYDETLTSTSLFLSPSIQSQLDSLSEGSYSNIIVEKIATTPGDSPILVDGFELIIQLDKSQPKKGDFESLAQAKKLKVGYKIF